MKLLISFFLTLVIASGSYSQFTMPCRYITQTNDTVNSRIKILKSTYGQLTVWDFFDKITIIDSVNGEQIFRPDDIKSCKFQYAGKFYEFYSKPVCINYTKNLKGVLNKFVLPVIIGKKASLFEYFSIQKDSSTNCPRSVFIFEKADSIYNVISQESTSEVYKKTLLALYKDDSKAKWLIDELLHSPRHLRNDIIEIVNAVNNH